VRLETDPSRLRVIVADDGRGFDVGAVDGKGLGLRFMHERAEEIGGCLAVTSETGQGTRLVLDVPQATIRSAASPQQAVAVGEAP
jgi:signal transduction histidine kinase